MTEIDLPSLLLIFIIIQADLIPIMAADIFVTQGDKTSAVFIETELVQND